MWVLVMEAVVFGHGAVPRALQLGVKHWSCGDIRVAGAAHLHGCAALTSQHWPLQGTFTQGQMPKFVTEFTQQQWGG